MAENNYINNKEDIDIHTGVQMTVNPQHLSDKIDINAIISRTHNPTAINGVIELLNDDLNFKSFKRAMEIMSIANSERHLQMIESALQSTIQEVKDWDASNSPYWNEHKASLYLFTLQYLITNLSQFKLPNNKPNKYIPKLIQKYKDVGFKAGVLGIDKGVAHSQCTTADFQQTYNADLVDFEFIDEDRIDSFEQRLKKYSTTKNESDLYEDQGLSAQTEPVLSPATLEKIIKMIETKYNIPELTLKDYTQHRNVINHDIVESIGLSDLATLYNAHDVLKANLTHDLVQYLQNKENVKNNGRTM